MLYYELYVINLSLNLKIDWKKQRFLSIPYSVVKFIAVEMQGPPQVDPPDPQIFELMGADNIVDMLEDFYLELGKSEISGMFPEDLKTASRKSAAFFIGLCGGPPIYHQLYGHPRLRQRHMPFPVDQKAQQVWLECFKKVLENAPEKYQFPKEHLAGFISFLEGFSPWMINS